MTEIIDSMMMMIECVFNKEIENISLQYLKTNPNKINQSARTTSRMDRRCSIRIFVFVKRPRRFNTIHHPVFVI